MAGNRPHHSYSQSRSRQGRFVTPFDAELQALEMELARRTDRPPTDDRHRVPYNPADPGMDPWWKGIPGQGPGFDLNPPHDVPPPESGNAIAMARQPQINAMLAHRNR
jgi:hypothetical protein